MDAFYRQLDENLFESTPSTAGPWSPQAQHAGPPSALLARAMERFQPREGMRLADVRTDILGPVPVAPLTVEVEVTRGGRSMELLEARALAGGKPVMLARGWRIMRAPQDFPELPGRRGAAPVLPADAPDVLRSKIAGSHLDGYVSAVEWRFEDPEADEHGTARAWGRQLVQLVEGEEPSPFQRALVLADSGGGISFALDSRKHLFINCDLQVSMDRDLEGEWMRMDSQSLATPGHGGIVHTVLADERGECGVSVQTMVAGPAR